MSAFLEHSGRTVDAICRHVLDAISNYEQSLAPSELEGASNPDGLSEREVEVLKLVAEGMSNGEIIDELFIARATVARHVSNILNKTGLSNRIKAASYAADHGLRR